MARFCRQESNGLTPVSRPRGINTENVRDSRFPDLHRHRPRGNHSPKDRWRESPTIDCGSTQERACDTDDAKGKSLSTGRLTSRWRWRSVRKMASNATQMRSTRWLARACGFVTILALVVAPVCAPLCAAQVCSQTPISAATEAHCHPAGATPGDAPQIHAVQHCGASELPAVVPTSSIKNDALQANRAAAFDDGFGVVLQELRSHRSQPGERCLAGPHSSRFSASPLSHSVLRF